MTPASQILFISQALLIACRLACSVTLGAYSYQQNPENKYLVRRSDTSFYILEYGAPCDDTSNGNHNLFSAFSRGTSLEGIGNDLVLR
jgi:hypothetical protein